MFINVLFITIVAIFIMIVIMHGRHHKELDERLKAVEIGRIHFDESYDALKEEVNILEHKEEDLEAREGALETEVKEIETHFKEGDASENK